MEQTLIEGLQPLHTRAIDAGHCYQEALDDAQVHGLTTLFKNMIALHTLNADELATAMGSAGGKADDEGSFMSVVHHTIMDVRSMFGGIGVSVLPGLIERDAKHSRL
jgi:uncharacterized protein (TIGR02284 family)